ncbi:hypothetical protein PN462_15560 [Spirulina sp. CS-785/01]|uniref:hypothetical protein n=1 Tax=Spirulina sp. CS-785/01 TaxID=3021716 RepID=UPI00232EC0B1|nr:hypothetical protein [Spirulina sp. CS-785/01]MDB9314529.1 hypothetical protein [Spirulina sp. CS-785/01]
MRYSIPTTTQEIIALGQYPLSEELIATAIAGVVQIARSQGQSLDELTAEVLSDCNILDTTQRRWLSELVTDAWQNWGR